VPAWPGLCAWCGLLRGRRRRAAGVDLVRRAGRRRRAVPGAGAAAGAAGALGCLQGLLPLALFKLVVPVLVSLVVIRLTVRVLHRRFRVGLVRAVERRVSWVAWIAVVLWITGAAAAAAGPSWTPSAGRSAARASRCAT
jgi:hypothetical protein